MKAIDIIHAEHRALGAVIQAFRFVLDGMRAGTLQPDLALLDALIEYITEVPDKLHHPKEDEVLFDWAGIDAAFEANKDPWSGPTGEFRALFSRIVNMVPAPYGLGPA